MQYLNKYVKYNKTFYKFNLFYYISLTLFEWLTYDTEVDISVAVENGKESKFLVNPLFLEMSSREVAFRALVVLDCRKKSIKINLTTTTTTTIAANTHKLYIINLSLV